MQLSVKNVQGSLATVMQKNITAKSLNYADVFHPVHVPLVTGLKIPEMQAHIADVLAKSHDALHLNAAEVEAQLQHIVTVLANIKV